MLERHIDVFFQGYVLLERYVALGSLVQVFPNRGDRLRFWGCGPKVLRMLCLRLGASLLSNQGFGSVEGVSLVGFRGFLQSLFATKEAVARDSVPHVELRGFFRPTLGGVPRSATWTRTEVG